MSDARRDRRQPPRRVAAGGSGPDRCDPRDIEIERLNQRIRELEFNQYYWEDDYHRRFAARGNGNGYHCPDDHRGFAARGSNEEYHNSDDLAGTCDVNYDSPPLYDVYGDEEWYSWMLGDEEEYTVVDGGAILAGEAYLVLGGPTRVPCIRDDEELVLMSLKSSGLNIQNQKLKVPETRGRVFFEDGEKEVERPNNPIDPGGTCLEPDETTRETEIKLEALVFQTLITIFELQLLSPKYMKIQNGIYLRVIGKSTDNIYGACMEINGGLQDFCVRELFNGGLQDIGKSIMDGTRIHAPFDPGGICSKPREMICEIELCCQVMIIKTKNRVDVPFEPGGKTRGRVFSKKGRMIRIQKQPKSG